MRKLSLSDKYKKYGLVQYPKTILREMKKYAPQQYKQYRYREKLLQQGRYKTYKREVFLTNLLDTIKDKIEVYGNINILGINDKSGIIPNDYTINDLYNDILHVPLRQWDSLSDYISPFFEIYAEEIQKQSDISNLQDIASTILNLKQSPDYKERKATRNRVYKQPK